MDWFEVEVEVDLFGKTTELIKQEIRRIVN